MRGLSFFSLAFSCMHVLKCMKALREAFICVASASGVSCFVVVLRVELSVAQNR
jgi:hypothetical protein